MGAAGTPTFGGSGGGGGQGPPGKQGPTGATGPPNIIDIEDPEFFLVPGLQGAPGAQGPPGTVMNFLEDLSSDLEPMWMVPGPVGPPGAAGISIPSLSLFDESREELSSIPFLPDLSLYFFLPGRSAGQVGFGGLNSSDSVTFHANQAAYATGNTGRIILDDRVSIWPDIPTNPGVTTAVGFNATYAASSGSQAFQIFGTAGTVNSTTATIISLSALVDGNTINLNASPAVGDFTTVLSQFVVNITAATTSTIGSGAFGDARAYQANGVVVSNGSNNIGFRYVPTFKVLGAAGSLTLTGDVSGITYAPMLNVDTVGGVLAITTMRGVRIQSPGKTGAGSAGITVTNMIGVDVEGLVAGSTLNAAMRSAIASASGSWFLLDTGGAASAFKGNIRQGDNTAPTNPLEIASGKLIANSSGIISTYNNITTVSNGIPSEYAKIDTTTLAANVSQTLLYAVPASGAGVYRVSAHVVVTRQATTSSTMPKIQIDWTDSDSNTAVGPFDITLSSTVTNPAVGANSAGQNLLTTDTGTTAGTMIISARQSTNINYRTTGYASVGATTMQYAIHIKLEAL